MLSVGNITVSELIPLLLPFFDDDSAKLETEVKITLARDESIKLRFLDPEMGELFQSQINGH